MSLDQRLSDAARRFADGVAPPDVDLDAVRSQARANRRRTVSLIAVAAIVSVVAAVTVVAGVGRDTSAPAPADSDPVTATGVGPQRSGLVRRRRTAQRQRGAADTGRADRAEPRRRYQRRTRLGLRRRPLPRPGHRRRVVPPLGRGAARRGARLEDWPGRGPGGRCRGLVRGNRARRVRHRTWARDLTHRAGGPGHRVCEYGVRERRQRIPARFQRGGGLALRVQLGPGVPCRSAGSDHRGVLDPVGSRTWILAAAFPRSATRTRDSST